MYIRYFLATIYKIFFSVVFRLIFGKDWFVKHKWYCKFDLVRHLFEIWFMGFCIRRVKKMVWSRLPRGIIAIQPFGIDGGIIVREIYFEQVYDRFYRLQNDDVVVDVGAHVGLFTLKVAKSVKLVLAENRIHSIIDF
ncbi:MAG: hypothetical protein NDP22_03500 [Crenarchaeota archaeon]|nr:hypothetical protein [Thermoproteota archaeon]